jgi:hypothetical protein
MTLAVQVSIKKPDGTIYVLGGQSVDEFHANLVALYGGDNDAAEELLQDFARSLSPMAAAVQTIQNVMPGSTVSVGTAPPRIAQVDTYFESSFSDKEAVKTAGGRWGKERRMWYAPAGSDLRDFERWIKP